MWNPDDHPELLNEELQSAIQAIAASDTPKTRRQLYEVLQTLTYCVIHTNEPDGTTTVSGIRTADGAAHMIAFSDPAALRRWDPDIVSFLTMTADRFFAMAKDSAFKAISLNPAGPAGGIIQRYEFAAFAEGKIPDVAPTLQTVTEPHPVIGKLPEPSELILRYKRRKMLPMLSVFLFLSGFLILIFPVLLQKDHLNLNESLLLYGGPVCLLILMPFTLGLICSVIFPRPALHLSGMALL
ncbi:MAG: SseB family protein [Akkermansiaceae bacterium]|nr:SseB family protein [Armatimonadota bacterium]